MARLIRCECGFIARGDNDDQVVGVIRGHMSTDHPALLQSVSRDDLISWLHAEEAAPLAQIPDEHLMVALRVMRAVDVVTGLVLLAAGLMSVRRPPGWLLLAA